MVISVNTKVNLGELNTYCSTRIKKMAVAVGTFEDTAKRKQTPKDNVMLRKHKLYGNYAQTSRQVDNVTNPEVAYFNITGHGRTPKRDFFKEAFSSKFMKEKNFDILRELYKKSPDIKVVYRRLGNLGQASVKRAIIEFKAPPNSKKTVLLKGFNNPLMHTLQLLKSIKWHPLASVFKYYGSSSTDKNEI